MAHALDHVFEVIAIQAAACASEWGCMPPSSIHAPDMAFIQGGRG